MIVEIFDLRHRPRRECVRVPDIPTPVFFGSQIGIGDRAAQPVRVAFLQQRETPPVGEGDVESVDGRS